MVSPWRPILMNSKGQATRASADRGWRLDKFGYRPDDPVWPHGAAFGQARSKNVMPDRENAEPLRSGHLPLQIVADHPGFVRLDAQGRHCVEVGALFGFAEAVLAFDLNVVEQRSDGKPLDLGALTFGAAVGDQRQQHASRPQGLDRFAR